MIDYIIKINACKKTYNIQIYAITNLKFEILVSQNKSVSNRIFLSISRINMQMCPAYPVSYYHQERLMY